MSGAVPSRRAARAAAGRTDAARSRAAAGPRAAAKTEVDRDLGRYALAVLVGVPALLSLLLLVLAVGGVLGLPGGLVTTGLALLPLAALGLAGLRLLNAPGPGLVGAPLSGAEAADVRAVIVDAAARVRAPAPRNLVVDGSALIRIAPSAEGDNLAVGLPLLLQLEPADLHAVLARELAQRSDAGPPAALRVRRLGERLDDVLATSRQDPVRWLLARYRRLHATLGRDAVLQSGRAADHRAGAAVGTPRLAGATERLAGVALAWRILIEEYLPAAADAGARPPLAEGLQQLLAHRGADLVSRARLPGNPDPLERLDPLAASPMFPDPATEDRIEAAILRNERPAIGWQQVSEVVGAAQVEQEVALLAGVVPTGAARPTVAGVLAGLERDDRASGPDGLAVGLTALAQHALITSGQARFTAGWAGPARALRREPGGGWILWDGEPLVTAAAQDPAAIEPLRSWLIAAGADPSLALRRFAPEPSSSAGPVQVTGAAFAGGESRADLMVFADGVLLARPGGPPDRRRGRWVGADEVDGAAVRQRRNGLELQLRFADGSALVVAAVPGTQVRGDPVRDLRRLLLPEPA